MKPNLQFFRFFKKFRRRRYTEIAPDEVLLDSRNLPQFDTAQFEGRLEQPISTLALYGAGGIFLIFIAIFLIQAWKMQVVHGEEYRERSENNLLRPVPVFAGRGVIYDRNGALLVWNSPAKETLARTQETDKDAASTSAAVAAGIAEDAVAQREYATTTGLAHVLGYVQYPSKDTNGFYYQEDFVGVDGAEEYYNDLLSGINGSRLVEVDARGKVLSHNIVRPPQQGGNLTLSIDSRVQAALYRNIKDIAERVGFSGGAGVIMDVETGEILALTSYPEYDPQVMSGKEDQERVRAMLNNPRLPFLDRAVDGLYTPGSIVKPYIALGVLNEQLISPSTIIVSSGSISIPNPYDSTKATIFRDWKAHGPVDLRRALAVSSDVYFYVVGGGFKDQKGLGISRINTYLREFGFGTSTPHSFVRSKPGVVPTPEWKKKTFDEDWYLGDTYNTAIGQYGFVVTPTHMVRAVAALANGGKLITPTIVKGEGPDIERVIDIPQNYFGIVREGMRMSVTEGTGVALSVPYVKIAAKSGTAELGVAKEKVNSWITGFWPYEKPRYSFVVMLEKGSVHNLIGAAAAMRQQLDWMAENTPEYFKPKE